MLERSWALPLISRAAVEVAVVPDRDVQLAVGAEPQLAAEVIVGRGLVALNEDELGGRVDGQNAGGRIGHRQA